MSFFEWARTIFDWFVAIVGILFALYFAILFVACVPLIVFRGTDFYSRIKRAVLHALCAFFVLGIAALIIWAGPLAPKKDLVVVTKELPKLDGSEGTSPAYCIYYVWDQEREEHPWWVIFQRPCDDGTSEWAILETADLNNVWNSDEVYTKMLSAERFDDRWFDAGMHRVQRTRAWKLRHVLVDTDEKFEKEKKAIEHVLILITGLLQFRVRSIEL